MSFLVIIVFLSLVLIVTNRAQGTLTLRPAVYVLFTLINVGLVLLFGVAPTIEVGTPHSTLTAANAQVGLVGSVLFAIAATLLLFQPVRRRLVVFFPRQSDGGFDPTSIAHMAALIFCVYLLANTVLTYLLAGGLAGLAQDYTETTTVQLLEQLALFVLIAAFGAGLGTRRTLANVAERLGLRWPTLEEMALGVFMGGLLIGFAFGVGVLWQVLTPKDVFDQQTQVSQAIGGSVNTITFALFVAACAAIGEEIAFRGALQPIFGLWPTAIIFALSHIQYTLTPATLLIVGVAIGLGWLRRRYNTTASLIAHFSYDFVLLALSIYGRYLFDVVNTSK